VAGGLCVEHELVTPLVERLVGTMDAVQGLPLSLVERLLHQAYYSGNVPPPDNVEMSRGAPVSPPAPWQPPGRSGGL